MAQVLDQELKAVQADLRKQPKFKINIQSTGPESGPVDITINGHNYHILRDHDVVVPLAVVETLKNAMIEGMRFDEAQGKNIPHRYARYPFTSEPVKE